MTTIAPVSAPRLAGIALLRDLPPATLEALERRLVLRRYAAGASILERDSPGRDVFFVLEGRVRVVTVSPAGREVILAEIGPGGHVGELAAVDGGPRSASVVAASPCLVGALDGPTFRAVLARHPEVSLRLLVELAALVRAADLKILELVTTGAVGRLCALLLREARPDRSGPLVVAELPTQEVLAAEVGTTRETVGKIMVQLARAGLVRRVRRTLHLLEPERLRALAAPGSPADREATRAREG